MKTFVIQSDKEPLSWYNLTDSSIANAGKPFFIPDFADRFEAVLLLAARLDRIGKGIDRRFARRYWSQAAAGVHFSAPGLRNELLREGKSPDMSHSFDRSLIMSPWMDLPALQGRSLGIVTGEDANITQHPLADTLADCMDTAIQAVSRDNTVKMGDIVAIPLGSPLPIAVGDRLSVRLDGSELLYIAVR